MILVIMAQCSLSKLRTCILDLSFPIEKRTHCAFLLRTEGSVDAARIIAEALQNRSDSSLMRHELAYILGQLGHREVSSVLGAILDDESDDIIVRHESAEAIGAIGDTDYMDLLIRHSKHTAPEISETCQIAVELLKWKLERGQNSTSSTGDVSVNPFSSVDPAPPVVSAAQSIEDLKKNLLDEDLSLFERYRAMFALRNLNNDDAAIALSTGLLDKSALFRHEIAYVLGQLQRPVTINALAAALCNEEEHAMVRHEAAEALGSIGGEVVQPILQRYLKDTEPVVKESCQVALNIMDYWSTNEFNE